MESLWCHMTFLTLPLVWVNEIDTNKFLILNILGWMIGTKKGETNKVINIIWRLLMKAISSAHITMSFTWNVRRRRISALLKKEKKYHFLINLSFKRRIHCWQLKNLVILLFILVVSWMDMKEKGVFYLSIWTFSGSLNVEDILSKHEALEEIDMAPEQQHSHSTCISIQEAILPILE